MYLQHSLHRFGKTRIQAHRHLLQCGGFQMEGFATNAENTWNTRFNTPTSAGGSEVSFGGAGAFASCAAVLPTNPALN